MIVKQGSSSQMWRDQRRTLLLEIVNSDPTRDWSIRDLTEKMLQIPDIIRNQPNLGKSTIHRDFLAINGELKSRREELASDYLDRQLDLSEKLIADLYVQYNTIDDVLQDIDEIDDPAERAKLKLDALSKKATITSAIDRLLGREAKLLPLEVPRKMEIDGRTVSINMDRYLEARDKLLSQSTKAPQLPKSPQELLNAARNMQDEPEIIDGDYEQ